MFTEYVENWMYFTSCPADTTSMLSPRNVIYMKSIIQSESDLTTDGLQLRTPVSKVCAIQFPTHLPWRKIIFVASFAMQFCRILAQLADEQDSLNF